MFARIVAIVLFSFWTSFAIAETTYVVSGVAGGETLNIRKGPSAKAAKVGQYKEGESGIRLFERKGNWGRVGKESPEGWVNMRFLKAVKEPEGVKLPLACLGTEPFWSLKIDSPTKATYTDPETKKKIYDVRDFERIDLDATMSLATGGSVTVTAEKCSDGMSDKTYPYTTHILLPGGRELSGCCK